jgi:hypothetical protein
MEELDPINEADRLARLAVSDRKHITCRIRVRTRAEGSFDQTPCTANSDRESVKVMAYINAELRRNLEGWTKRVFKDRDKSVCEQAYDKFMDDEEGRL